MENKLVSITWKNDIVMTTKQVAEGFGVTEEVIRQNFSSNKDRFTAGKHFYKLEGADLNDFKDSVRNTHAINAKQSLILYTKQGVARHSKMLGTDTAWDIFEALEENYFTRKAAPPQLTLRQLGYLKLIDATTEDEKIAGGKMICY
jgi:hypothetical protein